MYNWNTDEATFKKKFPAQYRLWRLTQLINYGLDGEKLDEQEVRKAWVSIKGRLAPDKRKALEFLLWNKRWQPEPGLLPDRSNYWTWRSKNYTS